jgi:hypothetical protein
MEYNDENLTKLDADGLSYSEIAMRLNVTRSVVAGRLARIREGKIARGLQTNPRKPTTGKLQDYSKRKPPTSASYPRQRVKVTADYSSLPPNQKPNKHSVQLNPRNHKPMTKSEMQEDLRKAVENTK